MGAEEKYVQKGMDDRSLLEHIAMFVPGYHGYRERNIRRDVDQLIRKNVSTVLKLGIKDLEWAYRETTNFGPSARVDEVNRIMMKTDKISQQIYHAKAGYSGIWQGLKVKEGELSELLRFDASLIDQANKVKDSTGKIREHAKKHEFDQLFDLVDQYDIDLDEIVTLISRRDEVILGLEKEGGEQ
ncbi:MAG TPA: hypothetical protein PLJ11_08760 [Methanomassiliicoccales archaeon]|nr:hypothetical protein [Methanomassiliicoccales archaeon]